MSVTKRVRNILLILSTGVLCLACDNPAGADSDDGGGEESGNGNLSYEVGTQGPAGGLIFYVDDDDFYDGFDYLEAAPADWSGGADPALQWQTNAENVQNTDGARGSGPENTEEIISQSSDSTPAAIEADTLEINGHDDWFLPSQTELEEMKVRLHEQGLGGFAEAVYWTSTSQGMVSGQHRVLVEDFDPEGDAANRSATTSQRVRPVRAGTIE